MDYDDDEFHRHNRQLVGEGCSKVSPVLNPYALPKFDFDDTLQEHLNFNSLVKEESFLGQEDNQWIEEYSRGSSVIEFNSSGVELRRNDAWFEATSSESVEMLLKSVGQEEKVVGKAVTEQLHPDICDETLRIPKAMDPNLNQEFSRGELDSVITNEEKVDNTFDDALIEEPKKDHLSSFENVGASVEEFSASGSAEESTKKNSTDVPMDSDAVINESRMYSIEKSFTFVPGVECVDNPSAESSKPFSENLLTETSNPLNENPSAESRIPFSENPSAENSILLSENLPSETGFPFSENPSTETSIPSSESPSTETGISSSGNPPAKNNIPFSQDRPPETSMQCDENPTETSVPFSESSSIETSIAFHASPSTETSIPFGASPPRMLELKTPDSPKSDTGSLSKISPMKISSIEENKTIIERDAQQIVCDASMVSVGNLPETGSTSSESMQVDGRIISAEPGIVHADHDDSFDEIEDGSLPLENNDVDTKVLQAVDSQKNVNPSSLLEGSKENNITAHDFVLDVSVPFERVAVSDRRSSPDTATAENIEQPKSPIFGVSLEHQDIKKNTEVGCPSEGNSLNELPQVESVVASGSKNLSYSVEKETSADVPEKALHNIVAHHVAPAESCNASQTEQEPRTQNDSENFLPKMDTTRSESSGKMGNNSQTGCRQDPEEPMLEVKKSNEHQTSINVVHNSSLLSNISNDVENKVPSVSLGKATAEENKITSDANKRADTGQEDKGSLSCPTFQVSNLPKVTKGLSKDPSGNQMDPKKFHEVSVSPRNPSGLTSSTVVKRKTERKPRRKSAGKENARIGTAPARDSVRGEISPVLLTNPATGQGTRLEENKPHENVAKPGVVLSSPKIPDLNNSISTIQQPFTDNQQVQLRAQILVYGSLISGSPPEETHMIAAFGQSDSGRTWESVWGACLERLHVQKSQSKSSIPVQSGTGSRSDQVSKHGSIQNKIPSSPVGGSNNKGTPPFVSPMIPFSSPLWNITTPPDNLQSSGMAKHPRFDYHQTLSPLGPTYQTPPMQNYVSSWLSQGPFSGQWLAGSPIPAFNPAPRFPSLPIMEPVKLTSVKESDSLVVKHTSNPTVLNSTPVIFPEASSVPDMKRSTVSADQPCSDSKSRKKKKGVPIVSVPCSTSVMVLTPAFLTSRSKEDQSVENVVKSEETWTKVEQSRLQAMETTEHADNAVFHCHGVWSQIGRQYNRDLSSNDEAKLVSSAVSIAAAASVAKAAAAAAKIASDVAEQARLMFNSLDKHQSLDQSISALASSKHAVNLDAIVKAAELAAEAVSQAGKIVAMSEPFSLRDLLAAGPEGYWKTPRLASKQQALVTEDLNIIEIRNAEIAPDKVILATNSGGDLAENQTMEVDGISVSFTGHEKDKRKQRARKASEVFKVVGTVPESNIGSPDTSVTCQTQSKIPPADLKESDIKEGCFVEVYKDDDKYNGSWFGANVLRLRDGKALVSYTEIQSDEGSGRFQEWLPLEVAASEIPKIRLAHPVTTVQGTRKRRRTAATDFMWSSGDKVDVWIQNRWHEGVVSETNKVDTTSLTVQFPAQGETLVVRSWFVRPTLIWKDGKWTMYSTSEKGLSSLGNMPQEKRLKLGSPIAENKSKDDLVDPRKQEESKPLSLLTHESVFNVGSTRDDKVNTRRTLKPGLKKEGPRVIFGGPKPGKARKFMDVSKHYVTDGSNPTPHDSIKFTKYLIPHPPGSSRGWRNNSRSVPKEKLAAEPKPQTVKSRKPPVPSFRTLSSKSTFNKSSFDSVSDSENQSGQQSQMEHLSSSGIEDKFEHLNKRKFTPAMGEDFAKVEKSLSEVTEPRRSNRRIQPTSRLLEGLQSSMTISKMPALSYSTQRSHHKVTPKGNRNSGSQDG